MTNTVTGTNSPGLREVISTCKLDPQSTLLDAIGAIDRSTLQLALVLGTGNRLLGLLTDGDMRRALLAGHSLNASIESLYNRNFLSVDLGAGRAEVLELMQSRQIRHVPILDSSGCLIGIHFFSHLLTHQERPNTVCILAGGRGTRLFPLTRELPKPMLKVAGRPILERILLHLLGHGLRRFYLSVNYLSEVIKTHFGDGTQFGCEISYLEEDRPLGTGGPLSLIGEQLTHPLLVMNGDLITQFHAGQLLDFHQISGADLTIASRVYQHTVPFGCLETENGQVVRIDEKPNVVKHINAGIYVIKPAVLAKIPRNQEFPITRLISDSIDEGMLVNHYEMHDDWLDVGQKDELARAQGAP